VARFGWPVDLSAQAKTVIGECEHKLDWATAVVGDRLVLCYLEHVKDIMYMYTRDGTRLHRFDQLGVGSIDAVFTRKHLHEVRSTPVLFNKVHAQMFFAQSSFVSPGVIYRIDLSSTAHDQDAYKLEEVRRIKMAIDFDPQSIHVEQVFYSSADGTKIPMYILHDKVGSARFSKIVFSYQSVNVNDGTAPALLYGYGGFNISLPPYFSLTHLFYLRHLGGVLAIANLRGGR